MNLNVRSISFILSLCLFNCGESLAFDKTEEQVVSIENQKPIETKSEPKLNEEKINGLKYKDIVQKPTIVNSILAFAMLMLLSFAGNLAALVVHDSFKKN